MPEKKTHHRRGTTGLFAQPLDKILHPITEKAIQKKGFAFARLITHWPDIIGKELATHCRPKALKFTKDKKSHGTLSISCHSAFAIQLQHSEAMILQRMNEYFGYPVVGRIKILQHMH